MNPWFGATLDVMGIDWNLITAILPLNYVVLLLADVSNAFALMPQSIQVLKKTAIDSTITRALSFSDIIYLGEIQDVLVDFPLHT